VRVVHVLPSADRRVNHSQVLHNAQKTSVAISQENVRKDFPDDEFSLVKVV